MSKYCEFCGEYIENDPNHQCAKKTASEQKKPNLFIKIGLFIKKIVMVVWDVCNYNRRHLATSETTNFYERGMKIVPDSISPDEGETPLRQYDLAVLRSRMKLTKAEGRMQVTNKRVLFRANGYSMVGKVTYQQEFAIDKIDGIEIKKDSRFRLIDLLFLLWIILPISSVVGQSIFYAFSGLGYFGYFILLGIVVGTLMPFIFTKSHGFFKNTLCFVGAGIMTSLQKLIILGGLTGVMISVLDFIVVVVCIAAAFSFCMKPNLRIEVKTSGGTPAIEVRHKFSSVFIWKRMEEYSGFTEVLPGKDVDKAINELGAMINDIKTLGDIGIDKWKIEDDKKI